MNREKISIWNKAIEQTERFKRCFLAKCFTYIAVIFCYFIDIVKWWKWRFNETRQIKSRSKSIKKTGNRSRSAAERRHNILPPQLQMFSMHNEFLLSHSDQIPVFASIKVNHVNTADWMFLEGFHVQSLCLIFMPNVQLHYFLDI